MLYLHKTLTKKIMLFIINNKSDEKDDINILNHRELTKGVS